MPTHRSALPWIVLLLGGSIAASCIPTANTNRENANTQAQNPSIPEYPPLYDVEVEVCGNIIAPLTDGERCVTTQLQLWGPIGEAKLVRAGVALPSVSAVEHKIAIASKGCYPVYSEPAQEQFYWADTIIQVNQGGEPPTIEMMQTQLSNQQVHDLVTGTLSDATVPTFGGVGCEPAPANLN
jgi:hypothetical protein